MKKLTVHRNLQRFWVDEKEALESSLKQLGSGIVLKPEIAEELKKKLAILNNKKKTN